jgi:hypothetical protein
MKAHILFSFPNLFHDFFIAKATPFIAQFQSKKEDNVIVCSIGGQGI